MKALSLPTNVSYFTSLILLAGALECLGQTTTFTYQGRLNSSNSPVSGLYDLRFTLYDAATGGAIVGGPMTNSAVTVTEGLFATPVDFGATAFSGAYRWLEIAVRPNGSTPFVPLERQPITSSPYAILAAGATNFYGSLAGDVTGTQSGTTVARIRGVNVSASAPGVNQILRFSGGNWTPGAVALGTDVSGTLGVANGGSGLASYAAGDLLYASAANNLARRAAGADGQVLTMSGGFPAWGAGNNHNHFAQAWSGSATDGLLVQNNSNVNGASALTGTASANSGLSYGMFGQSLSTSGVGVQGSAFATSGSCIGVSGESTSPAGYGVYGLASAGTGANVGVYGETLSTNGIGVYGVASLSSGVNVGVYGETFSPSGYGLYTPDRLYVGGTASIGGHLSMQASTRIFAAPGTAAFPTFSFSTNSSSGMFSPGTDLLGLVTAGTERLRIAGDGKIGLGRVPATNLLEVAGEASKNTAGGWLANSDARIKTAVRSLTNALQTIERVHPVAFRYTSEYRQSHPGIEDKQYHNVVAQEFAEVFPDYVKPSGESLDSNPILQVDTYPAAIYSIAAIQELHAELARLKVQNAQLEERLNRLETRFADGEDD